MDATRYTNTNLAVFRFRGALISAYHDYFDPRRCQAAADVVSTSAKEIP